MRRRTHRNPWSLGARLAAAALLSAVVAQPVLGQGRQIMSAGGSFYFDSAGVGEAIVLIHGASMDRRMWDPQRAAFAANFRVLRIDLRGAGRSPPSGAFHPANDILALLDSTATARAHIVGLSNGGAVAIDFALTYPDRVATLVVAEPAVLGYEFGANVRTAIERVIAALRLHDMTGAADAILESPAFDHARTSHPEAFAKVAMLVKENVASFAMLPRYQYYDASAFAHLGRLRPPTLLLVSQFAEPDAIAIARRVEQDVPNVHRVTIPRAGHMMNLENPEAFNSAVLSFLAVHLSGSMDFR